ncbi:predicted protein [Naegleria gruberi]|uniref:Predicted protein n=1 Tax=Naegleria gruberi TaxID=5762 RepID=D2VTL0_NAEGR|nr:uncharacterized protein NAEGRDRAFT_72340 [Naegleria gruberi]EFC39880.1 predicted protein [Naegleria gruberi]|eukprot:XP_002672624.1 predicted protein [Naegleria gruberi strain NEG-M]
MECPLMFLQEEVGEFSTTVYFRVAASQSEHQLPTNYFEPIRSEVIIDSYFEIPPFCLLEVDGDWPMARLIFSDLNTCKEDFILKSKKREGNQITDDSLVHFNVKHYGSSTDLVNAILENKKDKLAFVKSSVCQRFIATTHILRYVLQHKTDPQVELQLCSLKIGLEYYNFGKIKVGRKCDANEMETFFSQLNPMELQYIIPANSPVIRKMQSEKSLLLQTIPSSQIYHFIDTSLSESPLHFKHEKFNDILLETLEEVSEY